MHDFILKLSIKLDNSIRYKKTKSFLRLLLEDINYPYKRYFDYFMISLIFISIGILIAGKTEGISEWIIDFEFYFVTAVFSLEYLLRLWISNDTYKDVIYYYKKENNSSIIPILLKPKIKYIFSIPAIIDLIAIFPNFRIVRLLKLFHYMHGTSSLFNALVQKRFEFIFLAYFLLGIVSSLGSLFYIFEFNINENLNSYLDAIYWALVTLSTVGYGDITPVTDIGKIISMFGIIFGIAMISFVTSVMVSAFSQRFDKLRSIESIKEINRMKNVVIINGYGHLSNTIAKKLNLSKKYEAVIIENNIEKVNLAHTHGHKAIQADASSAKLIEDLYKKNNIVAMLTLTSSDIDNIYFILNAKSVNPKSVIYARINQPKLKKQYYATGVNAILEPYNAIDTKAFHYLRMHSKEKRKGIIFFGYTHKSRHLSKILQEDNIDITIYETSKERYIKAKEDDFVDVILVDSSDDKHLEYISKIKEFIIVCAMDDEALSVYYAITLRSSGFEDDIIALSDSKEDNRKLILAGVNKIFDMYEESAKLFMELIKEGEIKQDEKSTIYNNIICNNRSIRK